MPVCIFEDKDGKKEGLDEASNGCDSENVSRSIERREILTGQERPGSFIPIVLTLAGSRLGGVWPWSGHCIGS